MTVEEVAGWLDRTLDVAKFNDVSNNGIQIARTGRDVRKVAFGVDASVDFLKKAAAWGADLAVVHHGISWGGGIKRIEGGVYNVIKAAMDADMALYAVHLPLDANDPLGNNFQIAKEMGLKDVRRAFTYHGEVIGLVGTAPDGRLIGVCSGGAGEFAADAKALGCDEYITGEASWGDVIAAENVGMKMVLKGHYETETYGVKALASAMASDLGLETLFMPRLTSAVSCSLDS